MTLRPLRERIYFTQRAQRRRKERKETQGKSEYSHSFFLETFSCSMYNFEAIMNKISSKFKIIFGIVIGFNVIAFVGLLIWIVLNLKSVLDSLGL